jgi:hypothetical protein
MTDDLNPETIEPDEATEASEETPDVAIEPGEEATDAAVEEDADDLASLPPERLAKLLREKRAAERSARARLGEADEKIARLTETARAAQRGQVTEAAHRLRALPSAVADVVDRIDFAEVLGDDGGIDSQKLDDAIEAVFVTRPHWKMPTISGRSGMSNPGGDSGYTHSRLKDQKATWSDVLTP